MRTTKTLLDQEARKAIIDGVNAIFLPVRKTFGPQAKKALLYRTYNRGSRIVDDGHTVADVQEPRNQFVRLAAQTFKEACKRTNEVVGDGTSGTTIYAGRLMNDVYKILSENSSSYMKSGTGKIGVMTMRQKILDAAEAVKKQIREASTKIKTLEELEKIATVSVEDKELGKIIAEMAWKVGTDGFIDVVEGYKGEIETEIIEGFRFPAKVPAKAFVNNPARFEMVMKDCPVLVTNYALDNGADIGTTLQNMNQFTSKIIIIAPSFSDNVLLNMVNANKQGYAIFPVAVPSLRTEQFEDLAIYCAATFIDKNKNKILKNVRFEDLGFLGKLIIKDTENREEASATGGRGAIEKDISEMVDADVEKDGKKTKGKVMKERKTSPVIERINTLKSQLAETREQRFKTLMERRIASMASAVGIIRVGDSTQASSLYRKLKIEDAVYACKSALRSGYVKGGGLCLKEIADQLPNDHILKSALLAPYEQIQNSIEGGLEIGEDIIDPTDAVFYAIEFGTSVVANLATVEIITVEEEDPIMGEGEFAMARALNEFVINDKIHKGQIKENEREVELDRMNGMTDDELVLTDNG